ncbi:MAG: hypothetical protein ACLFV0_05970 [Nitriliruptoraceae bacterium]
MLELITFLAVEEAIPADHPAAILAIPIGLLFLSGSVYALLWSNYGARKAGAIYGTAFFGLAFLLGIFWWFGGPGIPSNTGINHLPGQASDHYSPEWFGFEAGSPRAEFFEGGTEVDDYVDVATFLGYGDLDEEELGERPDFGQLSGTVSQAVDVMQAQFLPVDDNGVAQIGVTRREQLEEDAAAQRPDDAVGRAQPFFNVQRVGDTRILEHPETGVLLATQRFQATATFTDVDAVPFPPVPVGEPADWFAFYDPGAEWVPAAIWTSVAFVLFVLSLLWLDRLEQRDKRLETDQVSEPERIAVPLAQ